MPADADHNKLIKQVVNATLKPYGLFQKGASRVWIEDNGWYLTVVEFQPSAWDKGTYLNVSVHFLWDERDYLNYDYYAGLRPRLDQFVSFDGDETRFLTQVHCLAELALDKVMLYRKLGDLEYAEKSILQFNAHHIVNTLYQRLMICGLRKNPSARVYYDELLSKLMQYADVEWTRRIYTELTDRIAPILDDPDKLYSYICDKIGKQRTFWQSKSSMKRMSKTFSVENR